MPILKIFQNKLSRISQTWFPKQNLQDKLFWIHAMHSRTGFLEQTFQIIWNTFLNKLFEQTLKFLKQVSQNIYNTF